MSVNKVILVGRLGKDPEVRYLDNNRAVANFSIATSENYKDREGNKQELTEWHDIEVWGELAKVVERYLKKGNMVYVEGKIRTNRWKDNEGNDRQTKRIRCENMTMLGGGGNSGGSGDSSSQEREYNDNSNQSTASNTAPINDDPAGDLPF